MYSKKELGYKNALVLFWVVVMISIGGLSSGSVLADAAHGGKLSFSTGEGDERISIVMDLAGGTQTRTGNIVRVKNAIADFELPTNQLGSKLEKSITGGDELVNEIEFIGSPDFNQTTLICRFTSRGVGGGAGNVGVSLLVAFSVDKKLVGADSKLDLTPPISGKLISSKGTLKDIRDYIVKDMATAGAVSKAYTGSIFVSVDCSVFRGFAVYDPTNQESLNDAYFELISSEGDMEWNLSVSD